MLLMSYLLVVIADIYLMIYTLDNPKKAKACFTVLILNGGIILASKIDSRVLTPRRINHIIKVLCSDCNTIAIGDTLYEYELV